MDPVVLCSGFLRRDHIQFQAECFKTRGPNKIQKGSAPAPYIKDLRQSMSHREISGPRELRTRGNIVIWVFEFSIKGCTAAELRIEKFKSAVMALIQLNNCLFLDLVEGLRGEINVRSVSP